MTEQKYRIVEVKDGFYVEKLKEWEEQKGWFWDRKTVQRSEWIPLKQDGSHSYTVFHTHIGPEIFSCTPQDLFSNIYDAQELVEYLRKPKEDRVKYPIYHDA